MSSPFYIDFPARGMFRIPLFLWYNLRSNKGGRNMNFSNYRFTLDIQSNQSQISLPVLLGDTSRRLYINLTDSGNPYLIEDGCRAVFAARKPDGNTLFNDCPIEDNTRIRYDFTANTASAVGTVECELRLYGPTGRLITTPRFIMVVDERVIYDDDIIFSDSEKTTIDAMLLSETERVANEKDREQAEAERQRAYDEARELIDKLEEQAPIKHGAGENSFIGNDTDNNQAIGLNSEAYGSYSHAVGEASHAEGIGTGSMPEFADKNDALKKWNTAKFHAAVGYNSRVQGKDCIALGTTAFAQGLESAAVGNRAVAFGNGNIAKGNNSFACGSKNVVEGLDAGCIGQGNTVNTANAFALGAENTVSGSGSAAIGCNNVTHNTSSYALGDNNVAKGVGSVAVGQRNQTEQGNSFAFGRDNTVTGFSGVAVGRNNTVAHQGGQAFGYGLKTSRDFQIVFGTHNTDNSDALFMIGKGSSSYPYNAFEVIYTKDKGVSLKVGSTVVSEEQLRDGFSPLIINGQVCCPNDAEAFNVSVADGQARVSGRNWDWGSVSYIPAAVDGVAITRVDNIRNMSMTVITSASYIGSDSQYTEDMGENELKCLVLLEGAEVLGDYAIDGCRLYVFRLPSSMRSLGNMGYSYTIAEHCYYKDGSLKYLGDTYNNYVALMYAKDFDGTVLTISNSTKIVRDLPHGGSSASGVTYNDTLTKIVFPEYLGELRGTVQNCRALTSVIMPKRVEYGELNSQFAYNCAKLTEISVPEGITTLPSLAFGYCGGLANVTLPSTLKTIVAQCFLNCTALTRIVLPSGITSIASNAFQGCSKLADIYVPWAEGAVSFAPWGATNATIHYEYKGE